MSQSLPLGHDFTRIWSASLITNLVDGVLRLAAPLLAVSLTEDPILIGRSLPLDYCHGYFLLFLSEH